MPSGNILVVDDDRGTRMLLQHLLSKDGYEVACACDGEEALQMVRRKQPDTIILDIMMPGINGYEVCRRLKTDHGSAHIPIIMLSSLDKREEQLQGIEAGADDFLTKPPDIQEVLLRVKNAVHTKGLHDEVRVRLQQLKKTERMRDALIHMIVHDIKSPMNVISGTYYLIKARCEAKGVDISSITEFAEQAADRVILMINSMLDLSRMENGSMPLKRESCDLRELLSETIAPIQATIPSEKGVVLVKEFPDVAVRAEIDKSLIRRVLENLLGNAVKFSPDRTTVTTSIELRDNQVVVKITDRGPGVPADVQDKIFNKFGQLDSRQHGKIRSVGLGLAFCKLAVEAHNGTIGMESPREKGCTFWFALPCEPRAE